MENFDESPGFISIKEVVHITTWLYKSAQNGEPFRIYATEFITSVLQKKNNKFYRRSCRMLVDIISYFNHETTGKYNIFVNDKEYKHWFRHHFEDNMYESIQITVMKK